LGKVGLAGFGAVLVSVFLKGIGFISGFQLTVVLVVIVVGFGVYVYFVKRK